MKNFFFILLLTLPLCHAQPPKNPTISPDYDSLKAVVSDLDKRQKEDKNLIDSLNGKFISDNFVTVKSTEKMQELHNKAFDKMQNSFNIFVIAVGIIITALTLISTILNIKIANDSKKEVKEEFEKISNKAKDLEEKIKEHDKSISDFKKNMDVFMEIKGNLKEKEKKELKEMAEYVKNNPGASDYEKALAEAAKYYYEDNYKSASESYETILKNYGDKITLTRLPQIYFQMAYSYNEIAQSGKNEDKETMLLKAIDKYNQVLELDSEDAMAYNNLGNVLMCLAELKTEKEEKEYLLNKAEEDCLKARDLGGDVYNLACVYAIKYGLTKKTESENEAFKYLEESLEKKGVSFDYIENDTDLASLNKDDPRYKKLKEKYGKK